MIKLIKVKTIIKMMVFGYSNNLGGTSLGDNFGGQL